MIPETKQTYLCGCGHLHFRRTGGCRTTPPPSYRHTWNSLDPIQWELMIRDSDIIDTLEQNMSTDSERRKVIELKNTFALTYGFLHQLSTQK